MYVYQLLAIASCTYSVWLDKQSQPDLLSYGLRRGHACLMHKQSWLPAVGGCDVVWLLFRCVHQQGLCPQHVLHILPVH